MNNPTPKRKLEPAGWEVHYITRWNAVQSLDFQDKKKALAFMAQIETDADPQLFKLYRERIGKGGRK